MSRRRGRQTTRRSGRRATGRRVGSRSGGRRRRALRWLLRLAVAGSFLAGLWLSGWLVDLNRIVVQRFEGRRFAVPSKVYSAPLVVYPGLDWQRIDLPGWLRRLGYREQPADGALEAGRFNWRPGQLSVHLRAFAHPLRPEPARDVVFRLAEGRIADIADARDGSRLDVVVLEPESVSAFLGKNREQRDLIDLDAMPAHLVKAIFAVEDRRFEQHHGVDFRRIVGALIADLRAGHIEQGGSTLTQQLVKNFFLSPERTIGRKLKEAVMALLVEAHYDKHAILQAYLNEIYLGQRGSTAIHGVGEAARFYFGKPATDLDLAEAALLVAIIQSPNAISPRRRPERALARRNLVLELMYRQGFIDRDELEQAQRTPLSLAAVSQESGEVRYFLDALSKQLPDVYDEEVLESDGLRIYSTLDPRMQRAAARALEAGLTRIEGRTKAGGEPGREGLQGCLVALRPQTGEVLALVGGRDYGDSQFNRCTQARRQVGSAFKAVVYVAGLDRSSGPAITLASRLDDSPFEVETPTGKWRPEDYDHRLRGPVSVRRALEHSLNLPAARLGERVGIARVIEMARRLGVSSPLPQVPSLALGTAEVSPIEIARVYATLANGGRRPNLRTFVDVVRSDGLVEENRPLAGAEPVLDPATAYLAVSLLQGVVDRGTALRIRRSGMRGPIAGKTGTTDSEYDLWFAGFTPELVAVVWVGYDEPRSVGVASSSGALPIWIDFMKEVVGDEVRGFFRRPPGLVPLEIDPDTGARALSGCPRHEREFFLVGTEPEEVCPVAAEAEPGKRPGFFRRTLRRWFGN